MNFHHFNLVELQAKDENASLAHYFDVISGTSTGGLMTAMLTSPNPDDENRPLFTPAEIVKFYLEYGPQIFNETRYILRTRIKQTITSMLTNFSPNLG